MRIDPLFKIERQRINALYELFIQARWNDALQPAELCEESGAFARRRLLCVVSVKLLSRTMAPTCLETLRQTSISLGRTHLIYNGKG